VKKKEKSCFSFYSSYLRVDQKYHPFITPSSQFFTNVFFTGWFREKFSSESTERMVSCPLDNQWHCYGNTLWLCQQFAIENGHRNSGFSH